jgi:hypothetical protein
MHYIQNSSESTSSIFVQFLLNPKPRKCVESDRIEGILYPNCVYHAYGNNSIGDILLQKLNLHQAKTRHLTSCR